MVLTFLLLAVLGIPYGVLSLLNNRGVWRSNSRWRGRFCVTLLFLLTGCAHFMFTSEMAQILPLWVGHPTAIIYVTGLLELAGAIGLWISVFSRAAGIGLFIFLAAVFPANIYAAVHRIDVGGQGGGPLYLLIRAPLQILLMTWVWYFTVRK